MKGLIIRQPWIDLILNGEKTWEIRGSFTSIRGKIALIQSGTKTVVGTVELVNCIPLPFEQYQESYPKHQITDCSVAPYKKIHAWVLQNAFRLATPIPYVHPQGAIIWVDLGDIAA